MVSVDLSVQPQGFIMVECDYYCVSSWWPMMMTMRHFVLAKPLQGSAAPQQGNDPKQKPEPSSCPR